MASFYITGDCHGDFGKIDFFCKHHDTSKKDYMIILGDSGINYWSDKSDKKAKRNISGLPISFLVIHGNHEERASEIGSYKQKRWRGGIVYYEEEFPDILFAKDGEIYDFNGKSVIAIGGAYSVDKHYRISVGLPWYESEQPSEETKAYVEEQLERCQWKVDFVLSHTCPFCFQPEDLFLDFIDQRGVDKSTEEWLEQIYKRLRYEKWYFGHFHGNRQGANAVMLYEEIRELGADGFLQRVGRPMYKKGDYVMFYPDGEQDCRDGKIAVVDAYGSLMSRFREACYDIEASDGILYKHIPETLVESIQSIKERQEIR